MSSDVILSVRNVSKRYEIYDKPVKRLWQMLCAGHKNFFREFWALKDISFEIRRGESVGIIGRNGAGKSTLLKIITGTLQKTTGTVWTKPGLRVAALLELGSGFNPEFTGRENVYLNASILGLTRKETEARYQEIINFADIGDFIDQPVKKYSSGMKVRLAFAVQIMVDPDILIVDEALSVGDMFFAQKCMHRMHVLREKGCTLFFVSHSLGAVRSLCDKAVYLKNGRVEMVGPSKDVCERYSVSGNENVAKPVSVKGGVDEKKGQFVPRKTLWRKDASLAKRITERTGSGALRYVAADFYDEKGHRVSEAECGQRLRYVVSLEVYEDIPAGAVTGIGCRDKFGNSLLCFNLNAFSVSLPALKKGMKRTVEYDLTIPLNAGTYFWSAGAIPSANSDAYYDMCFGIAALRVVKRMDPASQFQFGQFAIMPNGIYWGEWQAVRSLYVRPGNKENA